MTVKNEFISFIICGGIAALVNMGTRWLLNHILSYAVSICISYLLGMLTAFFLFKIWVFGATQSSKALRESIWFIIINALALFQTLLISIGLTDYVFPFMQFHFYPEDCAHIIGVLFPVFTSFIGHKYLTFKRI